MGREDFKASNVNPPENCGFSQVQSGLWEVASLLVIGVKGGADFWATLAA